MDFVQFVLVESYMASFLILASESSSGGLGRETGRDAPSALIIAGSRAIIPW